MNKIQVKDKATLDALYGDSAFTLEGLAADEGNLAELRKWVETFTPFKRDDVYVIDGATMNREYHLTGTNAYPDTGCTIICIKLSDLEKPMSLTIPRFRIGGRWFDDVVDNNARREAEKRGEEV